MQQSQNVQNAAAGAFGLIPCVFAIAIVIFMIMTMWKIYEKAGQPGWGCLIPFYNQYLLLKIAGRPGWWLLLYFIPVVNIVIAIIVTIDLAKSFGKDAIFAIGLILLGIVFFPILAFGDAQYQGPAAAT
jgi:hypothetical protein